MTPPECVSLDTKHILAWVKENNPKAYVPNRFNKARQPAGDPDCRLGCKRRSPDKRAEDLLICRESQGCLIDARFSFLPP